MLVAQTTTLVLGELFQGLFLSMTFSTDIHGPELMSPHDFGLFFILSRLLPKQSWGGVNYMLFYYILADIVTIHEYIIQIYYYYIMTAVKTHQGDAFDAWIH